MANQPPLSLKGRALRLLAAREHSRAELERKLAAPRGADAAVPDAAELARVLDELAAKGFISEQRVVESVLHRRAGKLGAARVLHELRQKGVSDAALAQAQHALRDTELARARAVWQRKFGRVATSAPERARQLRFLAARGFSGEVARRAVEGDGAEGDPAPADDAPPV